MLYRALFWLVLKRLPAETAHHVGFAMLRAMMWFPGAKAMARWLCAARDPALRMTVFGREVPSPLGLAAGFDKDGKGPAALAALGFGAIEVGTITAQPQPGNPKPRMFRLPADRALINRLGFNNQGADVAAQRLARRPAVPLLGINIGKTKVVPEEGALADYAASAERLAKLADYLVVNVSSPNTPGLRDLQAVDKLRPLLAHVRATLDRASPARRVPLLVKIAPDLADDDIDAVADMAVELGLDGIIATNTTIARTGLATPADAVSALGAGGLSGAPLRERSLAVLRRLHARTGGKILLVAAGGISNADDAWARIRAGATLVQGYTGFIYGGPLWPRRIHKGLSRKLREAGLSTLKSAVGTAAVLFVMLVGACDRGPSAGEIERLHAEAVAANNEKLAAHAAEDAKAPGKTLTVAGQIGAPAATFDWAALDALATTHVPTKNPQNPTDRARVIDFRGILVRDLLDKFQAAPDATEVTFVALDGFRSTVDIAGLRKYRVLLAIAADNAPIDRASGGPIYLVFPHSEAPETEALYPDRYWSFYVTHMIVGTEAPRLAVGDKVLDAAALAALPTTSLEGPVGWKVHWPSSSVVVRGVKVTDALAAAGVTVPKGGKLVVRGKAAAHRDPADPVVLAADDLERCGFLLAMRWGADNAPITAKLGGPIALAVPPACAAQYGDRYWITFVEELAVEP